MLVAIRLKNGLVSLLFLVTSCLSFAHTIYAPNDIPLLDNRFRIDPHTEQVTFILNHSQGPVLVVLIRPDGSKLYQRRHPDTVAWVSTKSKDIITIDNPMAGPWQAVANLDGDNRIKLLTPIELKTTRLPLKLYAQEYFTTHASLYHEDQVMTEESYLDGAKLSISLVGDASKKLTLYQDDGKAYDALPFDGDLTARVFVDLTPGRYLLNIHTKNDVFIRNKNYDAVVFPAPIRQKIMEAKPGDKIVSIEFEIDSKEIDPTSVTLNGTITNRKKDIVAQLLKDNINASGDTITYTSPELDFEHLKINTQVFATTRTGREIELQLAEASIKLLPAVVEVITTETNLETEKTEEITPPPEETSLWSNIWVLIGIAFAVLIIIFICVFLFMRRRMKKQEAPMELDLDGHSPASINIDTK